MVVVAGVVDGQVDGDVDCRASRQREKQGRNRGVFIVEQMASCDSVARNYTENPSGCDPKQPWTSTLIRSHRKITPIAARGKRQETRSSLLLDSPLSLYRMVLQDEFWVGTRLE